MVTRLDPRRQPSPARRVRDARGFLTAELLVSMMVTVTAMGAALAVTEQVSRGYTTQLDNALTQEEARFALEWVETTLRAAGANPYDVATTDCPGVALQFQAVRLDPNGNGLMDDLRLQADVNPPNGLVGGVGGTCDEAGEDVTIAHDQAAKAITLLDNNLGGLPTPMTDGVITGLQFSYLDATRTPTNTAAAAAFVQVSVTAESPSGNRASGAADTVTLTSEVRIRVR